MAGKMNVWPMEETESDFRETSFVKRVHLSELRSLNDERLEDLANLGGDATFKPPDEP